MPPSRAALQAFYDALLDDDAESLYDRAPCGYLTTTPDGTISKVNETFLALTGYTRRELVAHRTFAELLSPGGRIYHETHFAPLLRMQEKVREIAFEVVKADGARFPVLVNAVLESNADGVPVVIRIAVFEASDRRTYERELLQAKDRAESSEAAAKALVRALQQTLIPPTPPSIPGLDIGAVYRPAGPGEEVGGDFFDVFQVASDDWVVVLGDVCGKGVEAAVLTALVRYKLRELTVHIPRTDLVLHALNKVLLESETDRFCTVVLVRLRFADAAWTVSLSLGGHPFPLFFRGEDAPISLGEVGSLVGVLESPSFSEVELRIEPGETLLLYTDGVTEGRRDRGQFYGEERLSARLTGQQVSAQSLVNDLLADVLDFQQGLPRDDIAVVAIQAPVASTETVLTSHLS